MALLITLAIISNSSSNRFPLHLLGTMVATMAVLVSRERTFTRKRSRLTQVLMSLKLMTAPRQIPSTPNLSLFNQPLLNMRPHSCPPPKLTPRISS